MKKLIPNLSVKDYEEVSDLIHELLMNRYGIEIYPFTALEPEVEYVVGAVHIVKLGDQPDTLKRLHTLPNTKVKGWGDSIKVTDSYRYADYYRLDKLTELCDNHLTGSWSETYNANMLIYGNAEGVDHD